MSEVITTALVMMSEFAVMFALGFGLLAYKIWKRVRGNREQAKEFVSLLREHEPERNSNRIDILKEKYNLGDEEIQKIIEQMQECEKSLYGKILNIFMGKEKSKLSEIEEDVNTLITSCFVEVHPVASDDGEVEITVDSQELADLKKENETLIKEKEKLEIELEEARHQSEEMMAEYVRMYGKEGEKERHDVEEEREKIKKESILNGEDAAEKSEPVVEEPAAADSEKKPDE